MTTLILIDTDRDDQVLATVTPDGDGISVTGIAAAEARQIVHNRAELMEISDAAALPRLADYGWTNGRWALVRKE